MAVPKNSAILAAATPDERETLRRILLVKPTRTLSGVAPVAVMTSPYPVPARQMPPLPGRAGRIRSGRRRVTRERSRQRNGPASMTTIRSRRSMPGSGSSRSLGHRVEKVELIVMGGTMTARPVEYQNEFVSRCIEAMNVYPGNTPAATVPSVAEVEAANETADVRCIAITFETRPDWCKKEHIDRMLDLGVTKVELGVQHTNDEILAFNRRGCTVADTAEANRLLRDAGIKVGFHMMPNLPHSTIAADREMFETIFSDPRFKPDFLKIYPTLVTPGSEIEELWELKRYTPYEEENLIDLIAYAKSLIPEYTRLSRVQRDIPAKLIVAGSRHSNFRQLAQNRLAAQGRHCRCIRCREIGRLPSEVESDIRVIQYECCGGTEYFISAVSGDSLIGFARLRFPSSEFRPELHGAALVRGNSISMGVLSRLVRMRQNQKSGSTGASGGSSFPAPRRSQKPQGLCASRS